MDYKNNDDTEKTRQVIITLSYPDYDRRLWDFTRSADLKTDNRFKRSRASIEINGLPPVGTSTPP